MGAWQARQGGKGHKGEANREFAAHLQTFLFFFYFGGSCQLEWGIKEADAKVAKAADT